MPQGWSATIEQQKYAFPAPAGINRSGTSASVSSTHMAPLFCRLNQPLMQTLALKVLTYQSHMSQHQFSRIARTVLPHSNRRYIGARL